MAIILFDPYQVIKASFGMRNFGANLLWGMPVIVLLWLKVWLAMLFAAGTITGLTVLMHRYDHLTKLIVSMFVGAAFGLIACLVNDTESMNWRDIPFGAVVPWCYALAGAAGGSTLFIMTGRKPVKQTENS